MTHIFLTWPQWVNAFKPSMSGQNGHHIAHGIFQWIFEIERCCIQVFWLKLYCAFSDIPIGNNIPISNGSSNGLSLSHYLKQCWAIVNWTLGYPLRENLNQNRTNFKHENEFENVDCNMAAILYRPQRVKLLHIWGLWSQKQVSKEGMQLLTHAWDTCSWRQSLHMACLCTGTLWCVFYWNRLSNLIGDSQMLSLCMLEETVRSHDQYHRI